jgi:hypothetical protein
MSTVVGVSATRSRMVQMPTMASLADDAVARARALSSSRVASVSARSRRAAPLTMVSTQLVERLRM